MKLSPAFIATLALSLGLSVANLAASSIQLSELDLSLAEQQPKVIKPTAKTTMANVIYTSGYITHGTNDLYLSLDGKVAQFDAIIGIVDNPRYKEGASVRFEVIGDNRYLYVSDPIHPGEEGKLISVNTAGVKTLILVTHGVDKIDTLAMWANASFAFTGKAPVTISRTVEKPYVLTPPSPETPKINGASITGVRPTHPFLFKIPVTGKKPIQYTAKNLPAGLSLDSKTGIISGSIQNKGDYVVTLGAKNALGSAERELTIRVGDMLALTPQMGWNSWNCFASAVTAEDMKGAAEAFVKTGLIDHGWTYVNVDDYWETRPLPGDPIEKELSALATATGKRPFAIRLNPDPKLVGKPRNDAGFINPNARFPDMTGLVSYIHSLGLKAGLYSSPGPLTCGQCTASYGHEAQDAKQFAEWGFDYLKYDLCTYRYFMKDDSRLEMIKPYELMGRMLHQQSRDILYSLCQYGENDVWEWATNIGGNSWRTTGDIVDTWTSMSEIGFSQNGHEAYAGPGHWNDPDMLVVGQVGWGPKLHPTRLSPNEQYTHISLWSLLAAPLLIGCDLTKVDDFTLNLLTNDEVIAVDQDPLGRAARRITVDRNLEVWARPLADGSLAVGLFNRGEIADTVHVHWSDLGITGEKNVRDLWRQKDIGSFGGEYSALVPRHGVVLIKVSSHGG
jgi:alpha-galactosidase